MSNIDSLNESQYAKQVAAIAPKYGFVLRFPEGKRQRQELVMKTGILDMLV